MNRKQLLVLLVSGALIGGFGLYVSQRKSASWSSGGAGLGQKVLPDFPVNDIAHITIKGADGEVNLVKADDRWRVKERWDYPANFAEISELLRKMWELKTVRAIRVASADLGRLQLLPPTQSTNAATAVEFKDRQGKTVHSLLLGKQDMRDSGDSSPMGGGFPVGRFVMVPGGSEPRVSLISDPLSDIEAKPERWISKDFIKVEKLRSVSVTATNEANSWTLAREVEGGELKLVDQKDGEQFESSKASSVGWALSSPSFNDVMAPDSKPDETGLTNPRIARLETFDNFVYTVKIGSKTADDNYPIQLAVDAEFPKQRSAATDEKPEDKEKLDKEFQDKLKKLQEKLDQEQDVENWTYLVSKWTIDPLLKDRPEFLAEKKEETTDTDSGADGNDSAAAILNTDGLNPLPQLQPGSATPPLPTED